MARPATARWPAGGRTGLLDRPAHRYLPDDTGSTAASGQRPPADGPVVSAAQTHPIEPSTDDVKPDVLWALLPTADREKFGLRLSRLVLRAVRTTDTEEDA
jgi:hypothetical protein